MINYSKLLIFLFLISSSSYAQIEKPDFKSMKILKSLKNCYPDSQNCAYVKVEYLKMVSGKHKEKINKFINDLTISFTSGYGDSVYSSIETAAESFIKDFTEFEYEDSSRTPLPWFNEVSVTREKSLNSIICLTFSEGIFTGGAHPNYYQIFHNFGVETGDTIQLSDIFIKGFEKTLDGLLDKKYRSVNKISAKADLQNEGLLVSKIEHNNNFAISNEGVRFFYNQYEIASYAAGTIEINLTFKELSNIIKEDGIIPR
jgi:hypothetical protein